MRVRIILPTTSFGKTFYELLEPIILAGIKVPIGFISDGASVPRILWWLFPPTGRYFKAAVVHDYLLSLNTPRSKCNKAFLRALKEQKVNRYLAYTMYAATVVYKGYLDIKHWVIQKYCEYVGREG